MHRPKYLLALLPWLLIINACSAPQQSLPTAKIPVPTQTSKPALREPVSTSTSTVAPPTQTSTPIPPQLHVTPESIPTRVPESNPLPVEMNCSATSFFPFAFLPDNTAILGRGDKSVILWSLERGQEEIFIETSQPIFVGALSPDGQVLAIALEDYSIQLIRMADKSLLNTLLGHTGMISALKFSQGGDRLYSASHDTWIRIWDQEGNLVHAFQPGGAYDAPAEVFGIGISPDGGMLASVAFDGPLKLWNLEDYKIIAAFESIYGAFDGADAAFTMDGQLVGRGLGGGPIAVWDIARRTELWSGGDYAFAFMPGKRTIAYSGTDEDGNNQVVLRSLDGPDIIQVFEGHKAFIWKVIFSQDGILLASSDDTETLVWRVEDAHLVSVRSTNCLQP